MGNVTSHASHRLFTAMAQGYLVFFKCPSQTINTNTARFVIETGVYTYAGSCGVSCKKRILRHLEQPARKRWHVDYLQCETLYAVVVPFSERELAKKLAEVCAYVPHFGSTDDPESPSHLFRCNLAEVVRYIGLTV
ncbi:conserved hypothetical protein [Pyrobaculum islandicum DSM 4184]|uniref:GIY-YIG domain-containing protein n=2 Tax=Pyrobaculum islandicum TaxID=2277 RepID=A1RSN6_PYRIL|nr:conserved hypothetical protein [Pyrobaculum islandicum DSM 4184]